MGNCYKLGGCDIKSNKIKTQEDEINQKLKQEEKLPSPNFASPKKKVSTKLENKEILLKNNESVILIKPKVNKSQIVPNPLEEEGESNLKTISGIEIKPKATMPMKKSSNFKINAPEKTIIPHYKHLDNNKNLPIEELLRRERRFTVGGNKMENKLTEVHLKLEDGIEEKKSNKKIDTKDFNNLKCDIHLSQEDLTLITESLSNHILFKDMLTVEIIHKILEHISMVELEAGSILFNEGDAGDYFYILKEGLLELTVGSTQEKIFLKSRSIFGELALIQKNKRSGTIECIEKCKIFCIEGTAFREVIKKVNQNFFKDRMNFLSLIPIFMGLSSIQMHDMALGMHQLDYGKDEYIIKEGEKGESLYIIKEGTVSCEKGIEKVRELHTKDFFGELSILFETKRSLSIITRTNTICYQISKSLLIEILGQNFFHIILSGICQEALRKTRLFNILGYEEFFQSIYPLFKLNVNPNNKVIFRDEHYLDKKICVVIEGNLINSYSKEILSERGAVFEESLLEDNCNLGYDIICKSECITMEAKWDQLVEKINISNGSNKEPLKLLGLVSYIKKIQIFQNISITKLLSICSVMEQEIYFKGDVIFEDKSEGDKIFLVFSGNVKILKHDKVIRVLEEGCCFGEISLLLNEKHSATVIAATDEVVIYTLSKEYFLKFFDQKMIDILINKISLQDRFNTNLDNLYFIKKIGQGKFGAVSLVHNTKNVFAIKAVSLQMVEKNRYLIKYFQKERSILLSIDYHFIVKLIKTLKSKEHIFYLMEYVKGVTLSKYLTTRYDHKLKNKRETQFYVASLLLIVGYLNQRKITHRDLKPDNIMVNEKGFLKLVDFGTCTVINNDFTNTIIGTPHYMAPEILQRRGYSMSIDYWSIGIIMYELYFGFYPFGQNANDPMDVYREILKKDLIFTGKNNDPTVTSLLKLLLKKKVKDRICSLEKLKQEKFFNDFNWNDLIEMSTTPPFIPTNRVNMEKLLEDTKNSYINNIHTVRCDDTLLSSNLDDKVDDSEYDPNWAEEF